MARKLELERVCGPDELEEVARRLADGISAVRVAEWLRARGHIVTARDVCSWRDTHRTVTASRFRPLTPEDQYLDAIERMHGFCEQHELQFKGSMVAAIETFMKTTKSTTGAITQSVVATKPRKRAVRTIALETRSSREVA